jgi:thiamine-phosphate diphosphorylase
VIPPLHLVTDARTLAGEGFTEAATRVLEAGGDRVAVHLRGRGTAGGRLLELADRLLPVARTTGGVLLVNERLDVALLAGVHGVHLPEEGLPVPAARSLLPSGALVGRSVHGPVTLDPEDRPDYLLVGTIFSTPSHPQREGAGVDRIRRVRASAEGLPVVAIGGIAPGRIAEVVDAGADGVAVLRAVWDAPRPAEAVDALLVELERSL